MESSEQLNEEFVQQLVGDVLTSVENQAHTEIQLHGDENKTGAGNLEEDFSVLSIENSNGTVSPKQQTEKEGLLSEVRDDVDDKEKDDVHTAVLVTEDGIANDHNVDFEESVKEKESSEQVVEREREDFTKQEELKVSEDQLDSATSPTVTADAQQKHHLDMHEQQKQLFNTSNNENIENTDKTEELLPEDMKLNHITAEGTGTKGMEPPNGTSLEATVVEPKVEQKTKTKFCSIL